MIVTIDGKPLFYMEKGLPGASPVVFIHGFPFSHRMWKPQMEALSPSFRAIAYDVRGHGESYVGDGQYTIEGHVDDLFALLDALSIPRSVIVGLSMGGYITLRALERAPERFSGVVLCDTRSEADGNEAKLKRHAGIQLVKSQGSAAFAENFIQALFAPASLQSQNEAVDLIRDIIRHTPPLSIAGTLLALAGRTDTTASLGAIRVPTLILAGEHDIITPPAAAQSMHERIPQSELHIVPGAGHMSNVENPSFFNEKLLKFLRKI
jgi:3-oxoadipate enol-lactonase